MDQPFAALGLLVTPHLQHAFAAAGIELPTPVQAAAVPPLLAGTQVVVHAGTGTGKTLAYLLPLLQHAAVDPAYRAVVMAPSPELAVQILRVVEAFKEAQVSCLGLTGGGNAERQREKLKKHPQILVGTPGRLLALFFAKKLKAAKVAALVLDEVDEILSDDNDAQLRELLGRPECAPQLVCASATFGARAQSFMQACMAPDRVTTQVADVPHQSAIRHVQVAYSQQRKDVALLALLHKHKVARAMVFVNKLPHVGHLFRVLSEAGVPVATLSGERGKQSRQDAMRLLRSDDACVLVATDAASRGIDVVALDWVIHYEMARDVPTYLHRAGRTGRAGRAGTSLALVAPDQQHLVRACEKVLGIRFERAAGVVQPATRR